jgi:hypothetical protein
VLCLLQIFFEHGETTFGIALLYNRGLWSILLEGVSAISCTLHRTDGMVLVHHETARPHSVADTSKQSES